MSSPSLLRMTDNVITRTEAAEALVKAAGRELDRVNKMRETAMAGLAEAMRQADAAGVQRKRIAELAGVARATVYAAVDPK